MAHDCLYEAYWGKKMYTEAISELESSNRLNGTPDSIKFGEALDRGYRSNGWTGALTAAATVIEARRKSGYGSPFEIARLYAGAGANEKAFHWLDVAFREHDSLLLGLNVLPGFDKIRSDPRFAELVHKVGLPEMR